MADTAMSEVLDPTTSSLLLPLGTLFHTLTWMTRWSGTTIQSRRPRAVLEQATYTHRAMRLPSVSSQFTQ